MTKDEFVKAHPLLYRLLHVGESVEIRIVDDDIPDIASCNTLRCATVLGNSLNHRHIWHLPIHSRKRVSESQWVVGTSIAYYLLHGSFELRLTLWVYPDIRVADMQIARF